MRHGFGRAFLAGAALVCFSARGHTADNREAWRSPFDAPERASLASPPPAEALSVRTPDLVLVWFDPQGALPSGAEAMAREVQAIFEGLGVSVGWKTGALGTTFGGGPAPEVAVILLPADPVRARQNDHVMGLVMRKQEPRAMWVFLSNVRRTLGLGARGKGNAAASEWQEVGVALGRVVAHELIHSIVPEQPHAPDGLMHQSLGRAFLRAKQVRVDGRCARAFRSRLVARRAPDEALQTTIVSGP